MKTYDEEISKKDEEISFFKEERDRDKLELAQKEELIARLLKEKEN